MKAAAEGKRKAELAKRQNSLTQSPTDPNHDCDSSPSHSSSVHRSQVKSSLETGAKQGKKTRTDGFGRVIEPLLYSSYYIYTLHFFPSWLQKLLKIEFLEAICSIASKFSSGFPIIKSMVIEVSETICFVCFVFCQS